jgi:hypothetical protein
MNPWGGAMEHANGHISASSTAQSMNKRTASACLPSHDGLTIWLVLSVWALFSRGAYEGVTLSIITLFFVVLVGIPVILWLTWRRNTDLNDNVAPYREWSSGSFETWTGGISGREASMQILLPIAAVAFGMTIFGLVFLFATWARDAYTRKICAYRRLISSP